MDTQSQINYDRISRAISYLVENFNKQPTLAEIAQTVHLSPFHFQRLFTEWAGVSPKKFIQYLSVEHAKEILNNGEANIQETANLTGLSGSSRIHDLFINIEGMTPGEFKNKGENIRINYSFCHSHFGQLIIASTSKGICYMAFIDDETDGYKALNEYLPNADFLQQTDPMHNNALRTFTQDWSNITPIKLHLKGTDFQIKVWQTLLKIPFGNLSTYGRIAHNIKQPTASRAVGTAIGNNPVAYLIPCHRVIQSSGIIGGYMWGSLRKKALIGWEGCQKSYIR